MEICKYCKRPLKSVKSKERGCGEVCEKKHIKKQQLSLYEELWYKG